MYILNFWHPESVHRSIVLCFKLQLSALVILLMVNFLRILTNMFLFYFNFLFIRFQEAENDCTEALNLDDRYIKAYSRRATARKELGKSKECFEGMYALFITTYCHQDYQAYLFF